jgi:hypothetical protein
MGGTSTGTIVTDTADASDTKTLQLNGGGALSVNRGGQMTLWGNEGTTFGGQVTFFAGNVASGDIVFATTPYGAAQTTTIKATTGYYGIGTAAPRDALEVAGGIIVSNTGSGLKIGPGNATLTNTLYATATLNFPSTAAGTVNDLPITVAGAADGDIVSIGVPSDSIGPLAGGTFQGWASNGVCYIRFANNALVTAMDPASGTFAIKVDKFK